MTRESASNKGRRYLVEGRLTIRWASRFDGIAAMVRGDSGEVYSTQWKPGNGWSCTCPARTDQCAHLIALRLVAVTNAEVSG